jgi:hypothetical protein
MSETGNKTRAAEALHTALGQSRPAVAWVDRASMPYLQLPEAMKGHLGHFVAVCGMDGGDVLIDDLAAQPFTVPADLFEAARSRIGSYKNRLLLVEGAAVEIDLEAAIKQGIADCVLHLSSDSESFSLPTLRKWAKMMTDQKSKKGWPTVFQDRRGLFSTLSSIFGGIALEGAPGGLRGMYATFLTEAADIIRIPALKQVAEQYVALATQWDTLAEEALPDTVPQFRHVKHVMRQQHAVLLKGGEAWRDTQSITDELRALRSAYNLNLPMTDQDISRLFATLQDRLQSIYRAEVDAIQSLREAIQS